VGTPTYSLLMHTWITPTMLSVSGRSNYILSLLWITCWQGTILSLLAVHQPTFHFNQLFRGQPTIKSKFILPALNSERGWIQEGIAPHKLCFLHFHFLILLLPFLPSIPQHNWLHQTLWYLWSRFLYLKIGQRLLSSDKTGGKNH
jgi:hypothetical protein